VSGELSGKEIDLRAVNGDGAAAGIAVAHGDLLIAFAEGVVGRDDAALARARAGVLAALGPAALVDAAAVAANFQRMVRIADATGIPLEGPIDVMTEDMRAYLGFDRFGSAANTPPPSALKRVVGQALRPIVPVVLRLFKGRRSVD